MRLLKLMAVLALALAVGCDSGPKSSRGFTLPDGNVDRGRVAFTQLKCHQCHTVSGVELPAIEETGTKRVRIGGQVTRITTYGELVTSIINPSHKLAAGYRPEDVAGGGESRMTNYNHVMTVEELIDIVAFLQSRYELKPYEPTDYPMYY